MFVIFLSMHERCWSKLCLFILTMSLDFLRRSCVKCAVSSLVRFSPKKTNRSEIWIRIALDHGSRRKRSSFDCWSVVEFLLLWAGWQPSLVRNTTQRRQEEEIATMIPSSPQCSSTISVKILCVCKSLYRTVYIDRHFSIYLIYSYSALPWIKDACCWRAPIGGASGLYVISEWWILRLNISNGPHCKRSYDDTTW